MRLPAIGVLLIAALAFAAACGDDDGRPDIDIPSPLSTVCSQTEAVLDPDILELTSPEPNDSVTSPLHVAGSIDRTSDDGTTINTIFVSLVIPDGTHVIDYPITLSQSEERVTFDQEIPFTYFERSDACLWIYQESLDRPEALRIPVALEPQSTPTP